MINSSALSSSFANAVKHSAHKICKQCYIIKQMYVHMICACNSKCHFASIDSIYMLRSLCQPELDSILNCFSLIVAVFFLREIV